MIKQQIATKQHKCTHDVNNAYSSMIGEVFTTISSNKRRKMLKKAELFRAAVKVDIHENGCYIF